MSSTKEKNLKDPSQKKLEKQGEKQQHTFSYIFMTKTYCKEVFFVIEKMFFPFSIVEELNSRTWI